MHIPRVLKAGAALTGIAAAAGAVAYALSRRPYLREVAPGLRSPVLYLPMHVLPDATFARASRFFATIDFSRPIRHAVDITELSASFDGHAFSAPRTYPTQCFRRSSRIRTAPRGGVDARRRPSHRWACYV